MVAYILFHMSYGIVDGLDERYVCLPPYDFQYPYNEMCLKQKKAELVNKTIDRLTQELEKNHTNGR